MKHLILLATLAVSSSAFARKLVLIGPSLDFRSNKYIVSCGIDANIDEPDSSTPVSGKSSSGVHFYIADNPKQKYTSDRNLVQRVSFRVDGGAAMSLYQICKDKLNSRDKRAELDAEPANGIGQYSGTWVSHTIINE